MAPMPPSLSCRQPLARLPRRDHAGSSASRPATPSPTRPLLPAPTPTRRQCHSHREHRCANAGRTTVRSAPYKWLARAPDASLLSPPSTILPPTLFSTEPKSHGACARSAAAPPKTPPSPSGRPEASSPKFLASLRVPMSPRSFPSLDFAILSQEPVKPSSSPVLATTDVLIPRSAGPRPIALGWSTRAPSRDFPHRSPELPLPPTSPLRWTTSCRTESPSPAHHGASPSTPTTPRRRAVSSSTPGRHTPSPARPSAARAALLPPPGLPRSRRSILPFSGRCRRRLHRWRQVRPSCP